MSSRAIACAVLVLCPLGAWAQPQQDVIITRGNGVSPGVELGVWGAPSDAGSSFSVGGRLKVPVSPYWGASVSGMALFNNNMMEVVNYAGARAEAYGELPFGRDFRVRAIGGPLLIFPVREGATQAFYLGFGARLGAEYLFDSAPLGLLLEVGGAAGIPDLGWGFTMNACLNVYLF